MIASTNLLRHAQIETPIGTLTAVASDRGLAAIAFPHNTAVDGTDSRTETDLGRLPAWLVDLPTVCDEGAVAPALDWLRAYFADERPSAAELRMPLDLGGTDFERSVWDLLLQIPLGETRSYGQLATQLGKPGAARAVGLANGKNPIPILIPCHRVIGASGKLTGFGGGLWRKEWLLGLEQGGVLPL